MATRQQSGDQLRNQLAEVADNVTSTAGKATASMKDTVRDEADARLHEFADQVSIVSDALRQTAQSLRSKQQPALAGQAERLAMRAETMSRHLRESSVNGLLHEAEAYTRSRPGLVLSMAALAGFTTARLLKVVGAGTPEQQTAMTTTAQSGSRPFNEPRSQAPHNPSGVASTPTHTPVETGATRPA